MKTKNYLSIISILFFSFLFVSCSKEDEGDTIKPVIDLLEPEEGAILRIGSSHGVHFEMNLHDIEAIASYEEFIRSWHFIQRKTQEIMEQKKDDSLTKKINLFVLQEFYVNPYTKDEDFYLQYVRREQKVLTVLEGIANS